MPKGGARVGAGRKPGRATAFNEACRREAARTGKMPLDVMLECMRKADAEGREDDAAKYAQMAAPYLHAKLATVQHSGAQESPVELVVRC